MSSVVFDFDFDFSCCEQLNILCYQQSSTLFAVHQSHLVYGGHQRDDYRFILALKDNAPLSDFTAATFTICLWTPCIFYLTVGYFALSDGACRWPAFTLGQLGT